MPKETNEPQVQQTELAAIKECVKEAIITKTLDGIITAWNSAAEHMLGYRADEIVGKSFDILVPPANRQQELEILERVRRGERTEDFDTGRIHKDGRIVGVSVTFSPVRDQVGHVA